MGIPFCDTKHQVISMSPSCASSWVMHFRFESADQRLEYDKFWKITEVMNTNVLGFQTHRDHFAVDFEETNILRRFQDMRESYLSDDEYVNKYEIKNNRDWQLDKSRKIIRLDNQWKDKITNCLYRPFDWRYCYFSYVAMDYPRRELIDHVLKRDNLCLLSSRQQANLGYRHCWVSNEPSNDCVISTTSREANQVFPLYLYPTNTSTLFETEPTSSPHGRRPNLAPEFINELSQKLGLEFCPLPPAPSPKAGEGEQEKESLSPSPPLGEGFRVRAYFTPEDIFYYIYATFHSPHYRQRYAEFLKIDFPRVPLTSNKQLFWELVNKGDRLVQLHLMKEIGTEISSYPIDGSNLVEQVKYNETQQQNLDQRPAIFRERSQTHLELLHRRLSSLSEMAQRPQRTRTQL